MDADEARSGLKPGADGECAKLDGLRALVVDDDADARELVKRLLEDCGATVTLAASAAEALAHFRDTRFDVLVSDIGMPGEDGYTLVRRIRSLDGGYGRDIPAVALTAYARPHDRLEALRAGFHAHVAKPIDPPELIATIASLAGRT
jgi:CheY-like chemotaxis protein